MDCLEKYIDGVGYEQITKSQYQELTKDSCIDQLRVKLQKTSPQDVRVNSEQFIIDKITTVYVPVHEARCVDPKKKIGILRIDGITKKILG